ncbi:MAG: hypothetical protein PHC86_09285, partial [Eubacteriales bacterium]|nr:hypothetical protein [Eubacteriales bacterium]
MRLQKYFLALFIVAITLTTWQAWPSFYENTELLTCIESDYLPYRLHQGDSLVQEIRSVRDGMNQITLSFDLPENQKLPEDTLIRLDIYSDDSNKLEQELLLTEADLKLFARTVIPISLGYQTAGQKYKLTISVDKLDERSRLAIHTSPATNAVMTINGQSTGLATILSINYLKFNWLLFSLAIGLFGIIFILIFLPLPRFSLFLNRYASFSLITAPFLTLGTVELLNTLNTNVILETAVLWVSLLIILLFELLLVSLLGRVRLAIYLNYMLFVSLGLANHLKLFFRGDPFVAGDLNSITETAHTINQLSYIISNRFLLSLQITIIFFLLYHKAQQSIGTRRSRWTASAIIL